MKQDGIHSSELLLCGCRVNPKTGETFSLCPRHVCGTLARAVELPAEPVRLPKDPTGQGMKPLCPHCASSRIRPNVASVECDDCGAVFSVSEIVGYGLSFPDRPCPECGGKHFGPGSVCSSCHRQGAP